MLYLTFLFFQEKKVVYNAFQISVIQTFIQMPIYIVKIYVCNFWAPDLQKLWLYVCMHVWTCGIKQTYVQTGVEVRG